MLWSSLSPRCIRGFVFKLGGGCTNGLRYTSSTTPKLQDAFLEPSSPSSYAAPEILGGPRSPNKNATFDPELGHGHLVASQAKRVLTNLGYDPAYFWEQKIVWGDHDSFQHVNNTRYVRFFESGLIQYLTTVGHILGGPAKAEAMIKGQGISIVRRSIYVEYKRPVTYPDTLLIAHEPYLPSSVITPRHHFHCRAVAYSYAQRMIVAESDGVLVWYDHENRRKCYPGDETWDVVLRSMSCDRLNL